MREDHRGAAGVRVALTAEGLDVFGWCSPALDASAVAERLQAELDLPRLGPNDVDGGFDHLSIWGAPTGEIDGDMLLRGQHVGRPLHTLVVAARS